MAVAYRSAATTGFASGGNLTVNKPSGTAENDILIGIINTETSAPSSPPSGWSTIATINNSAGLYLSAYWLRAGASEPSSYTWTISTQWRAGMILAISGAVTSGDPQDATYVTDQENGTPTATVDFPSLTTNTDGSLAIAANVDWHTSLTSTQPTGWNERVDSSGLHAHTKTQTTAGGTGATSATLSDSTFWTSIVLAIKPPGAGAVTVACNAGTIASAGRTASTQPGAVAIAGAVGTLASAGQTCAVVNVPPPVAVPSNAGVIASAGQAGTVQPGGVTVASTVGILVSAGQAGTVQPGAVTIAGAVGVVDSAGQTASAQAGAVTVTSAAGILAAAGITSSVIPGGVTVTSTADVIASAGWGASVDVPTALTLEQEGFRFRADDGSESAASWLAGQDVSISRIADTVTRLRVLVNATGDPSSIQYQLEFRRSGGAWKKINTN